jgi:hypothetical protein
VAVITPSAALVAQFSTGFAWGQRRSDVTSESVFGSQSIEIAGPRWTCSLAAVAMLNAQAGAWQALLLSLKGKVNQLALWNEGRPLPLGTMRGTMTLNASAALGDTTLSITAGGGQAGKTLLAGDMLGLGTGLTQQVIMLNADATANGSGVIVATFDQPLRNAFASSAAVTWDHPAALFRQTGGDIAWQYDNPVVRGFALSLLEDWRP